MFVALAVGIALLLSVSGGGELSRLRQLQLRGEVAIPVLLCAQALLPLVGKSVPVAAWIYPAWVLSLLAFSALAFLNWRHAGMRLVGLGVALNALVIILNGGMPVLRTAAAAVSEVPVTEAVGRAAHLHHVADASTHLPILADAIPLAVTQSVRGVISPGDVLLLVGAVVLVVQWCAHRPPSTAE